jgi:hypothetical protein
MNMIASLTMEQNTLHYTQHYNMSGYNNIFMTRAPDNFQVQRVITPYF